MSVLSLSLSLARAPSLYSLLLIDVTKISSAVNLSVRFLGMEVQLKHLRYVYIVCCMCCVWCVYMQAHTHTHTHSLSHCCIHTHTKYRPSRSCVPSASQPLCSSVSRNGEVRMEINLKLKYKKSANKKHRNTIVLLHTYMNGSFS